MKTIYLAFVALLVVGCSDKNISSITTSPVGRLQLVDYEFDGAPFRILCALQGVDTTGIVGTDYYEGLGTDAIAIGHRSNGGDDRCDGNSLLKRHGYVMFDLSEIGPVRGPNGEVPEITSVLLAASIQNVSVFDGGEIGCRTSPNALGIGMLDYIFWAPNHGVFPDNLPTAGNTLERYNYTDRLRIENDVVGLNRWMRTAYSPSEFLGKSPGAMTVSLGDRAIASLQSQVEIGGSSRLERFGVFFVGTDGGTLTRPQTCIQMFDDIQLTVFYSLPNP